MLWHERQVHMKLAKSTDVDKIDVVIDGAEGVAMRRLVSKHDGAQNFAMRMFEVQPGGNTPLHTHPHEHEVFVVEGTGVLVYEGAEHEFGPEDVVFVPGGAEHCFKNTGESLCRFLCVVPTAGDMG